MIHDEGGDIIAGANGFIMYGTVYTDQLWVDKKHRNKGLAKKILTQIHDLGKAENCKMATVQTMTFQEAIEFYAKLGYQEDFRRSGYTEGTECVFMRKEL